MIIVNLEVRFANSMKDCPEYFLATKEEILQDNCLEAYEAACLKYPKLKKCAYVINTSKRWDELQGKVFWFKEHPAQDFFGICFIVKTPVSMPTGEIIPIYLSLPPNADVPEIVVDFREE